MRIRIPAIPIFLLGVAMLAGLRAESADSLARIHAEAMGGPKRIAALTALQARGYVVSGNNRVRFSMIAARPNQVRVETHDGHRMLVQASDGVEPPWEFDTSTQPPRTREMPARLARTFAADAEFDDPLVAGVGRGYSFDLAGEVTAENRRLLRVLVTRNLVETFSLLVDPETYLIAMRVDHRTSAGGRRVQIVTRFADFRPVGGVLLPHQVTVLADDRVVQQTTIERMEANPPVTIETFSRPKDGSAPRMAGG